MGGRGLVLQTNSNPKCQDLPKFSLGREGRVWSRPTLLKYLSTQGILCTNFAMPYHTLDRLEFSSVTVLSVRLQRWESVLRDVIKKQIIMRIHSIMLICCSSLDQEADTVWVMSLNFAHLFVMRICIYNVYSCACANPQEIPMMHLWPSHF